MSLLVRKLESVVSLSEEVRQAILSLPARTRVLNDGQDIVREGDKPSQSCFILDGWAYRYKMLSEGRRQILSFHIPGDIPDLQSLHIHTMDHSLCTLTEASVAFIPHESLRDLTKRLPMKELARLGMLVHHPELLTERVAWTPGTNTATGHA